MLHCYFYMYNNFHNIFKSGKTCNFKVMVSASTMLRLRKVIDLSCALSFILAKMYCFHLPL